MKIDTQDLRCLYQAAISHRKRPSPITCPAPRRMIGLFDGSLAAGEKNRLIDHLTRCGPCFREFESYRSLYQQQEKMITSLEAWVGQRKKRASYPAIKDRQAAYNPPSEDTFWGRFKPRSWARTLSLAMLLLGLILGLSRWTSLKNIFENRYRAAPGAKIALISPSLDKLVQRQSLVFQWAPLPGTEYYVFELFDETLSPIWRSPEMAGTKTILPGDISGRLHPLQTYYWVVTGILADGKKAESDIGAFRLKRP